MTLQTGNRRTRSNEPDRARAFTLIELILVMALLLIVIGVALPSLKRFFHGRNLDSEARRFLSLTRYGQSRAVSEATVTATQCGSHWPKNCGWRFKHPRLPCRRVR